MNQIQHALTLEDIQLVPADFSQIRSRKDVDTSQVLCGRKYNLPIVSSNMTAVYSPKLAHELAKAGGVSCVHRFCTIEENVKLFKEGIFTRFQDRQTIKPWVSIGTSTCEMERAEALHSAGAEVFVIDVAMGAAVHVVEQYDRLRTKFNDNTAIVVGNFTTERQLKSFEYHIFSHSPPDLYKVGIGNGSACTTRRVTGCGVPSATAIGECSNYPIILDGAIKEPGDLVKVIALGAKGAMIGRLFAQCVESGAPYNFFQNGEYQDTDLKHKIYRGSASRSSYVDQGKIDVHRAPEGKEYIVPVTGTVEQLMQNFNGGLRSAMSYMNAKTISELQHNAEFVQITSSGITESFAYGKNS